MIYCIYFVCCFIVLNGIVHAECPLGWHYFGDSCYYFSTEALSWYNAEMSCRGHNARLAEVETKAQSDYLIDMVKRLGRNNHYWLGGRDDVVEGTWTWASSDMLFTFTAWGPGEPNGHAESNCLSMYTVHNYLWSDDPCSTLMLFICEKKFPDSDGQIIGEIKDHRPRS